MLDIPTQMAGGGDVHVTWPHNPVGSGSRGHKPASNKRPRQGTAPPTPCSPNDTFAYVPPSHPAAAPTSATTSAFPEARQPTGKGAPVLQSASPAAQPAVQAVHAAHAQVLQKPDQPAELPSGVPHQLPMSAMHTHTSSLPQPQLLPQLQAQQQQAQQQQQQAHQQQQAQQQQASASQQPPPQPQLQSLSQAPLPQSQITQMVMSQPGQSQPAAGVSFDRLLSQPQLANHQTSAAVLYTSTNLQQSSAASHAHAPAQTGGLLYPPALPEHTTKPAAQPVAKPAAQPVTQAGPGQSRVAGEPSAVAASKQLTLPALVKSSSASEDSKNADILNAQSLAAADGMQPMDLDESITGKKGRPMQAALCVATLGDHSMWAHVFVVLVFTFIAIPACLSVCFGQISYVAKRQLCLTSVSISGCLDKSFVQLSCIPNRTNLNPQKLCSF